MVNLNGIISCVASTCIDDWQPEVKGLGLSSGGEGNVRGACGGWMGGGLTGEQVGWVERGDGVLQVTVQVKRQILSAVWRKALKVPTVQRERSSYVWNTSSAWFQGECVEVRVAAAGQQERKVKREKKPNISGEDSRLSTSQPIQPPVSDFTFTSSKGSFAAQMWESRGRARYVNSAAYDMTWRIAPRCCSCPRPYSALQSGSADRHTTSQCI